MATIGGNRGLAEAGIPPCCKFGDGKLSEGVTEGVAAGGEEDLGGCFVWSFGGGGPGKSGDRWRAAAVANIRSVDASSRSCSSSFSVMACRRRKS